jgi:hypothetical protein
MRTTEPVQRCQADTFASELQGDATLTSFISRCRHLAVISGDESILRSVTRLCIYAGV